MSEVLKKHEDIVARNFSGLVGRVLTQVEASIGDPTQRKSFKKIIEGQIYDCRNAIMLELDAMYGPTASPPANIEKSVAEPGR